MLDGHWSSRKSDTKIEKGPRRGGQHFYCSLSLSLSFATPVRCCAKGSRASSISTLSTNQHLRRSSQSSSSSLLISTLYIPPPPHIQVGPLRHPLLCSLSASFDTRTLHRPAALGSNSSTSPLVTSTHALHTSNPFSLLSCIHPSPSCPFPEAPPFARRERSPCSALVPSVSGAFYGCLHALLRHSSSLLTIFPPSRQRRQIIAHRAIRRGRVCGLVLSHH